MASGGAAPEQARRAGVGAPQGAKAGEGLTTDEATAFRLVAAAPVARLATLNASGGIDMVPITFALIDRRVVTAIDHKPKRTMRLQRLANLRRDPLAFTVLVDHYEDDWSRLWWVRLRGRASIVEDGADHTAAIDALVAKYHEYRTRRPTGPAILIDVSDWRGWAASALP